VASTHLAEAEVLRRRDRHQTSDDLAHLTAARPRRGQRSGRHGRHLRRTPHVICQPAPARDSSDTGVGSLPA